MTLKKNYLLNLLSLYTTLKNKKMKHTKGIWKFDTDMLGTWISVDSEAAPIAKMGTSTNHDAKANAEFICTAVNSFDKLTAKNEELENALRGIIEIGKRDMSNPKYDGYFEEAKEVLSKLSNPSTL